MTKTDRMLLIEERAGKDIREVLREAYAEGGSLHRTAAIISQRYAPVGFGLVSDWIEQGGGVIRKELEFPCVEAS